MSTPLDTEGPVAPPRSNGELVFAEPWEGRAFGMAVTLYEAGVFSWPEFQTALIARITAWTASQEHGEPYHYYRLWLGAYYRRRRAPTRRVVLAAGLTARGLPPHRGW